MSRDRRPSVELSPAAHERKRRADRERIAAKRAAERERNPSAKREVPRIAAQERSRQADGRLIGIFGLDPDGSVHTLWEPRSLEHESYAGWLDRKARERALPEERPVSVRVGTTRLSFHKSDGPDERERVALLVLDALDPDPMHAPELRERIVRRLQTTRNGETITFPERK